MSAQADSRGGPWHAIVLFRLFHDGLRPSTFPGDRQAGVEANLLRGSHWLPLAWALVWTIVLGLAFFAQPWPYVDVVEVST